MATIEEQNHRELVLGEHSRSCGQWDIWEAVFGPVCADGFPCRLYDKRTGAMNASVAQYWRENFDLVRPEPTALLAHYHHQQPLSPCVGTNPFHR